MKSKIFIFITLITGGLLMFSCISSNASKDSTKFNRFSKCGNTPNCVSSLDKRPDHFIEPFQYTSDFSVAKTKLRTIIETYPRTRIVADDDRYLRVEFMTKLMRFVDDVEFEFDETASVVHVKSASRVGYSDMGVNRKRVEELGGLFNAE